MLPLVLWSTLALSSQVRLLTAQDAPVVAPAAAEAPPEAQSSALAPPELHLGYHFAAGAAAAVVFVPVSLYLAQFFGSLSKDLVWAAIPALLCMGLIPPIAITLATVIAGNWNSPGRYRWWPAFLATLVINGISLPIAASLGLTVGVAGRVIVYTLVQAVMQPGTAVLLERAWPRPQPTVLTVRDPVAPTTYVVPTGAWSF